MKHGPHLLAAMSWPDFRGFVVKVLRRYYGQSGIELTQKAFEADIGRDGHAVLTLSTETTDPVSTLARMWVEVKQRRGVAVTRPDIHGQVLLAFLEAVTKLVIVTNSTFSAEFREAVKWFASRLRLQYALIDGDALISLARESGLTDQSPENKTLPTAPHAGVGGKVSLRWTLAPDPAKPFDPSAGVYRIPAGDPVFLLAEVAGLELKRPFPFSIEVTRHPKEEGMAARFQPKSGILGQCDRMRFSWPLWAGGFHLDASQFKVELRRPSEFQHVEVRELLVPAHCNVNHSILGDRLPPSRGSTLGKLKNQLGAWMRNDGFHCVALISSAGSGKSHLLRLLRQAWLPMEVEELYLEGGIHNTDRDVFSRVCDLLIPMRDLLAEPEDLDTLRTMLRRHQFSENLAELVANWIVFGEKGNNIGESEVLLGRSLGRLIARRAKKTATVVSFDDLHKTRPSVLATLSEAIKEIRENRDAKVLFVLASREVSLSSESSTRILWERNLDELLLAADPEVTALPGFSVQEGTDLLQSVAPRLHQTQCHEIFDVVGRTPFALREALAFFRDTEVLRWDEVLGEYLPLKEVPVERLRKLNGLSEVTQFRLRAVRHRLGGNVLDFLDAGACLGRTFRNGEARLVAKDSDSVDLDLGIGELERLEILRSSRLGTDWLEFDHDLIRRENLAILPGVRHRRIAAALLDRIGDQRSHRTAALLAYQAGRARECLRFSTLEADAARRDRRFADEAELMGLAVSVLEPISGARLGLEECAFFLDDAISLSPPVSLGRYGDRISTRATVLNYLQRLAQAASHVGSGSSEVVERAATEGLMLAESLSDSRSAAQCSAILGRVLFERDRVKASVEQHWQAELAFKKSADAELSAERGANLVRLAISERELGQLEASRDHLKLVLEIAGDDPELRIAAVTNLGASYFHVDWEKTRENWEKALVMARDLNLSDQDVHLSLDLNRLDLLEGRLEKATAELDRIERLLNELRLDYPSLRFLNQRGVLCALTGDFDLAERSLRDAENYAIRHKAIRRLWKIRANLATIFEARGNMPDAYAQDLLAEADVSRLLNEETLRRPTPQRAILPIANIILRKNSFRGYPGLIGRLAAEVVSLAEPLAMAVEKSDFSTIPFSLARHCVPIKQRLRFVTA